MGELILTAYSDGSVVASFVGMHCFDHIVLGLFCGVVINNQLLSICCGGGARAHVCVNSPRGAVVNASIERHRAC